MPVIINNVLMLMYSQVMSICKATDKLFIIRPHVNTVFIYSEFLKRTRLFTEPLCLCESVSETENYGSNCATFVLIRRAALRITAICNLVCKVCNLTCRIIVCVCGRAKGIL